MLQPPTSAESQQRWATLLYRGAWYAWLSGNISDIGEMASLSRDQRIILLGDEHEEVINSTLMLASSFVLEGRWEAAEQLQLQAIQICKTKLGEDHPTTLTSMANLAVTFSDQGRWKEAEDLEAHVLEIRKAKLGEGHPQTLISMSNLAHTWKSSGRDAEAIDLLRSCLAKQKQIIGPDHPHTLSTSETLLEWETSQPKGLECETSQRNGTRNAVKRLFQELVVNWRRR